MPAKGTDGCNRSIIWNALCGFCGLALWIRARHIQPEDNIIHSQEADMKTIQSIHSAPGGHWVGDGFPVRSLFNYHEHATLMSPFLLLDYAGPAHFEPAARPRGVGAHPHRGFETVTIVYQGELEHRDSTGEGGHIGPGDVQWMTAAGGILHEEFHSREFTRTGGTFEVVQLWVNLPAAAKMDPPRYQLLTSADIPVLTLEDEAGTMRIIAGEHDGQRGPAHTHTPMQVWDMRLKAGKMTRFELPRGHMLAVVVLDGSVKVNDVLVQGTQFATLDQDGTGLVLSAKDDSKVLLLSGEPIAEPVVGHGPFVMNNMAEIRQAIIDFNSGGFGEMPA